MKRIVFYSWQSDLPNACNRGFIQTALERAAAAITADDTVAVEPVVDRDTQGVAGAPDIASTIFAKIDAADVFVADITITARPNDGRVAPNPNVLVELGFAFKALGYEKVILVFNRAFGKIEELPFDLRMRRVISYDMPAATDERASERKSLEKVLDQAIRSALEGIPEREGQATERTNEILLERATTVVEEMIIGHSYTAELQNWTAGNWKRSDTYFKLALIPKEQREIPLDVRPEQKFVTLIHKYYRRVQSTLGGANPVANDAHNRNADFYEYRWYHKNLDYEGRWRITDRLQIAHATQIKEGNQWSLLDVVVYTILFLRVAAHWWKMFNYSGNGILFADLSVPSLELARGASGQFLKLFGPGAGDFAMRPDVLLVHTQQRPKTRAYIDVNSATMLDSIPLMVTSIMNLLLRSLGHAVLWAEFEDNVRVIANGV